MTHIPPAIITTWGRASLFIKGQARIIWALLMREMATRYGRDDIGFLWLVCEPLLFIGGVMIMWSLIRPPYEHGIRLVPFLVTGYLPLILLRHTIGHGLNCIDANASILYHRKITLLHLFVARSVLEILGVTLAFIVTVVALIPFGIVDPPKIISRVYTGWFLMAWMGFGFMLILSALAKIFEFFEKIAMLITYIMVPATGSFFMVAWVPYQYRAEVLKIPFINCTEMIRSGFFGEYLPTYYNVDYACISAAAMTAIGLFLLQFIRKRIELD